MEIRLPYGNEKVSCNIPDSSFIGFLDPPFTPGCQNPVKVIEEAIDHPIGTPRLEDMGLAGKKVCIITDDISRPTPVSLILHVLLPRLNAVGVSANDITIIMALGSHRYMTEEEMKERVGADIYARYKVLNSEFKKPERLVFIGKTPEGAPLYATRDVIDADVRIGIGNLVPHPVMGWGGGGKILYPGVAGEDTVSYFHLKASLYDENMFGKTTTPIREMMETWVPQIGLDFIINTVLNSKLALITAVAGHYVQAQRKGVELGKKYLGCKVNEKADIVLFSSHPADEDFWQSPKAMYGAEDALKGERGGIMIMVSPNYEGIGPHKEYPLVMGRDDGDELVNAYIRGECTDGDPLAVAVGNSMSKMRRRRKLVVVGDGVTREEMESCGCIHYPLCELQKAIDDALREYPEARISILSNGADTFLY